MCHTKKVASGCSTMDNIKAEAILSGIKVLDLGHYIAGPYAAKLLADNGAYVIKIEQPAKADISRWCGPFPQDIPDPEASGLFLSLNTSKKGITLDITIQKGKELFLELVKKADVIIENFKPSFLPSLGLGYDDLSRVNPKLVMTSISNFGQSGPYNNYEATEITFQASGGLMAITGESNRPPLSVGVPLAHYLSGLTAFTAMLAALYHAEDTGDGQHVDIAICEAIPANIDERAFAWALDHPERPIWDRTGQRRGSLFGLYECQDGLAGCATANFFELQKMADAISPELANKEKFGDFFWGFTAHGEELEAICVPWFLEHKKMEVMEIAQERGLSWSYVATIRDLVDNNPQLREQGSLVELEHPRAGKLLYFVPCSRFSETEYRMTPAPMLGQHNEEVYSHWLGTTKEELAKLAEERVI